MLHREISSMEYVIGRRGSLSFLESSLASEVLGTSIERMGSSSAISGNTLRLRVEKDLELAPGLFAIGSLTGDSLIRFAYGGCVFAARGIMRRTRAIAAKDASISPSSGALSLPAFPQDKYLGSAHPDSISTNGHSDLHLDRTIHSLSIAQEISRCELWQESGWWAGGCKLA